MFRTRIRWGWAAAILAAALSGSTSPGADPPARRGGRVSRYDIATRGDLLLGHLVAPSLRGDVADWMTCPQGRSVLQDA